MKITIPNHLDRNSLAPLYHRYPQQIYPQPAYLEIDPEKGAAILDWSGEIGNAVPAAVWHGRILRVSVSNTLTWDEIYKLVEDEAVQDLIARIIDGHETIWDGSNHVGHLSDDARAALEGLGTILESYVGEAQVWEVEEWLEGCVHRYDDSVEIENVGKITAFTTDAELVELAEKISLVADTENVFLDGDPETYLRELRDSLK